MNNKQEITKQLNEYWEFLKVRHQNPPMSIIRICMTVLFWAHIPAFILAAFGIISMSLPITTILIWFVVTSMFTIIAVIKFLKMKKKE